MCAALTVRPSIGLTLATADMNQSSVSSLIRQADLAMYAAKRDGGACVRSFVPDLPNPYELPRRLPVVIERPTPGIDGSAVGGAEGLAPQRPAAIPEPPRRPPLAVRLALLALCWPGLWCSRSRPRFAGDRAPFTCYYQPKINASDESVHSVEALVRWRHPTRGLLLPDQFLPAAE